MRHIPSIQSPRSAHPAASAASAPAAPIDDLEAVRMPGYWAPPQAAEADGVPVLPDMPKGEQASRAEALRIARAALSAQPYGWARAMELLFELGMGNMEDARQMRNLGYTAAQLAKRESCVALQDKIQGQRNSAFNGVMTASAGAALGLCSAGLMQSDDSFYQVAGMFGKETAPIAGKLLECLDFETRGRGLANESEVRQKAWDNVAEPQGKIESTAAERRQQSQRDLSALLDMLLQVEQRRGQVVSQINSNI